MHARREGRDQSSPDVPRAELFTKETLRMVAVPQLAITAPPPESVTRTVDHPVLVLSRQLRRVQKEKSALTAAVLLMNMQSAIVKLWGPKPDHPPPAVAAELLSKTVSVMDRVVISLCTGQCKRHARPQTRGSRHLNTARDGIPSPERRPCRQPCCLETCNCSQSWTGGCRHRQLLLRHRSQRYR